MKRVKTHRSLFFFLAFFIAVIIYLSCKKPEQPAPVPSVNTVQKTFFTVPVNTSPVVAGIINALNRENEKFPFAETMVKNAGYPQWAFAKLKTNPQARQLDDDVVVNIPLVEKGVQETSAILVVNVRGTDTSFQLVYPEDYLQYQMRRDTTQNQQSAAGLFNVFANFDYELFGTTQYLINDGRIFGWEQGDTLTATVTHPESAGTGSDRVNMSNAEISTICNVLNLCPATSFRRVANNASFGNCITNVECTVMVVGAPSGGSVANSGSGVVTGGGGTGTTSTSTSLSRTPCTGTLRVLDACSAVPWTPKIYNKITEPCMKKMVDDVISRDCGNQISSFIRTTFGKSVNMDLDFLDASLASTDDGKTNYTCNGTGDYIHVFITLNSNPLALPRASREYIAITILHEAIHTWIDMQSTKYVSNSISHEQMTSTANINLMASALQEMYPSISTQDAQDLAWGGLDATSGWANLSQADRDRTKQTNFDYKIRAKGTPCN